MLVVCTVATYFAVFFDAVVAAVVVTDVGILVSIALLALSIR